MSYFLRNTGSAGPIGVILVLFLLGSRGGRLPSFRQIISYGELRRNMHRMVDMLDQLEGLSQLMAPQITAEADDPAEAEVLDADDADLLFDFSPDRLPDMGRLMEMAAPFLAALNRR